MTEVSNHQVFIEKIDICGFNLFKRKTTVEFDKYTNVITGETATGKSSIVQAIHFLFGHAFKDRSVAMRCLHQSIDVNNKKTAFVCAWIKSSKSFYLNGKKRNMFSVTRYLSAELIDLVFYDGSTALKNAQSIERFHEELFDLQLLLIPEFMTSIGSYPSCAEMKQLWSSAHIMNELLNQCNTLSKHALAAAHQRIQTAFDEKIRSKADNEFVGECLIESRSLQYAKIQQKLNELFGENGEDLKCIDKLLIEMSREIREFSLIKQTDQMRQHHQLLGKIFNMKIEIEIDKKESEDQAVMAMDHNKHEQLIEWLNNIKPETEKFFEQLKDEATLRAIREVKKSNKRTMEIAVLVAELPCYKDRETVGINTARAYLEVYRTTDPQIEATMANTQRLYAELEQDLRENLRKLSPSPPIADKMERLVKDKYDLKEKLFQNEQEYLKTCNETLLNHIRVNSFLGQQNILNYVDIKGIQLGYELLTDAKTDSKFADDFLGHFIEFMRWKNLNTQIMNIMPIIMDLLPIFVFKTKAIADAFKVAIEQMPMSGLHTIRAISADQFLQSTLDTNDLDGKYKSLSHYLLNDNVKRKYKFMECILDEFLVTNHIILCTKVGKTAQDLKRQIINLKDGKCYNADGSVSIIYNNAHDEVKSFIEKWHHEMLAPRKQFFAHCQRARKLLADKSKLTKQLNEAEVELQMCELNLQKLYLKQLFICEYIFVRMDTIIKAVHQVDKIESLRDKQQVEKEVNQFKLTKVESGDLNPNVEWQALRNVPTFSDAALRTVKCELHRIIKQIRQLASNYTPQSYNQQKWRQHFDFTLRVEDLHIEFPLSVEAESDTTDLKGKLRRCIKRCAVRNAVTKNSVELSRIKERPNLLEKGHIHRFLKKDSKQLLQEQHRLDNMRKGDIVLPTTNDAIDQFAKTLAETKADHDSLMRIQSLDMLGKLSSIMDDLKTLAGMNFVQVLNRILNYLNNEIQLNHHTATIIGIKITSLSNAVHIMIPSLDNGEYAFAIEMLLEELCEETTTLEFILINPTTGETYTTDVLAVQKHYLAFIFYLLFAKNTNKHILTLNSSIVGLGADVLRPLIARHQTSANGQMGQLIFVDHMQIELTELFDYGFRQIKCTTMDNGTIELTHMDVSAEEAQEN